MNGKIPESFISTVVSRIDIVELIGARIALRKTGANFSARCPFHAEKTPSFSVSSNKQFYHCFGCGASGDAIKFLMEHDKLSFVEAIEELASRLGLDVPYESYSNVSVNPNVVIDNDDQNGGSNEQQWGNTSSKNSRANIYATLAAASKYFSRQLKAHPAAEQAVNYLKKRGLTGEIAKEFGLGYAPPGWENLKRHIPTNTEFSLANLEQAGLLIKTENKQYDRFRNRIIFPIRDRRGRVIGFGGRVLDDTEPKYLNSPETEVFRKGEELYGLYEACKKIRKLTLLLVVEGYLDVIALSQAGIYEVVATLGTALTQEHLKLLFRLAPEITFCFDADQAGYKAAIRALELTLPSMHGDNKVSFMFLPQGEDPDSFVRAKGREAFLLEIKRAMPLADFLFSELHKNMNLEAIEDRAQIVLKAQVWLEQMPDGVFKRFMYDRLARLVGLDYQALIKGGIPNKVSSNTEPAKKWTQVNGKWRSQPAWPTEASIKTLKSPGMVALALLLMDRSLLAEVGDDFITNYQGVDLAGVKLLCAVISLLKGEPKLSKDNLALMHGGSGSVNYTSSEFVNDSAAFPLSGSLNLTVAQIKESLPAALARHFVPEELYSLVAVVPIAGTRLEFLGAIVKIKSRHRDQTLDAMLSKAKQKGLSEAEKVQLQQLLMDEDVV